MDIPVSTMTAEEARSLRASHDAEVHRLSRMSRGQLADIDRRQLQTEGSRRLLGGPATKDEYISAIIGRSYPLERLNESIHVLHHAAGAGGSSACEWCHPHGGTGCDCRLGR